MTASKVASNIANTAAVGATEAVADAEAAISVHHHNIFRSMKPENRLMMALCHQLAKRIHVLVEKRGELVPTGRTIPATSLVFATFLKKFETKWNEHLTCKYYFFVPEKFNKHLEFANFWIRYDDLHPPFTLTQEIIKRYNSLRHPKTIKWIKTGQLPVYKSDIRIKHDPNKFASFRLQTDLI